MRQGVRRTRSLKMNQIPDRTHGRPSTPTLPVISAQSCAERRASARECTGCTCVFQPEVPEAPPHRPLPSGARVGAIETASGGVVLAGSSCKNKGAVLDRLLPKQQNHVSQEKAMTARKTINSISHDDGWSFKE